MSNMSFKLVPKMENNKAIIYIVLSNGESREVCWLVFPDDSQLNDNMEAINQIIPILRKRIKRSM